MINDIQLDEGDIRVNIEQITDKNSPYLPTLIKWNYDWWGIGKQPLALVRTFVENALCKDRIPQTFVAIFDKKPVGMYQLAMDDSIPRPDIYPWLINVYVTDEFRGKGIARQLMWHVKSSVKKLKLKEIYLYTTHIGLYEKYDWKFVEMIETFKPAPEPKFERLYKLEV